MTNTPETNEFIRTQLAIAGMTLVKFAAKLTLKCEKLERERDEAQEQRNDAIEMMRRTRDNSGEIIASQVVENIILTQQRDRLAKILENIRSGYGGQIPEPDCNCGDCEFLIEIDSALQFLTPNKP